MSRWLEPLAALGRAFIEVLAAELEALSEELRGNARRLALILALFLAALQIALIGVGLAVLSLVRYLSLFVADWLAALLPGVLLLLVALVLVLWARASLGKIEMPGETVKRRWREQNAWWQAHVLPESDEMQEESRDED